MTHNVGDRASLSRTFSETEVRAFSALSLDNNPVHLDAEYAAQTRFGTRIVHGFFVGSMISSVIASKLPGPGSIYLEQHLKFLKPVRFDEEVTAEVEVIEIPKPSTYVLRTICRDAHGDVVIDGRATVKTFELPP